ncbi:MAG: nitroreductase family protein [Defluviitaleaceae bacterium]|nr:nitroreductase family protein [Defluviitaleaceae bacterium]MCL2275626.1 nitroreductase family protein [Defluviitaleaceae bacterium]
MLLDLLKKRYSCRAFSPKKISAEIVNYMLECARLSPSGGNEQPWKFGVITDTQRIHQITEACSENYPQPWIRTAPLLIALCTQIFDTPIADISLKRFPSMLERMKSIDKDVISAIAMEEHQVKIPGTHMVLAALEHGIQSTWISGMNCEKAGEILGVEGYLVSNIIAFGYPLENKTTTAKKHPEDIMFTKQPITICNRLL